MWFPKNGQSISACVNNNNNNFYSGYPLHWRVFQWGPVTFSGDYWGDFDYCDSIAIVASTIAIL